MYPVLYVPAGDVIPIMFSTYAGATGASITLTGLAVTDVEIYKDGSVTQRASDAGYVLLDTDGIDFDGTTGIHGFSVDTGDNTDASFYTVGAWFTVVVSAVTVDSQTVNFIAAMFRLMPAESSAGVPKVDLSHISGSAVSTTTAQLGVNVVQLSADATAADNAEAFFDGTGYAGTNNVIPTVTTTTTATNLTNLPTIPANWLTAAGTAADFTTEIQSGLATAAALDTVDNFLDTEVAAILAAVDTEVAAIKAVTDLLPDAGALTSLATQASVNTIDDLLDTEIGALTTAVADLPTNAELATALGTADDAVLAQVALVKAKTDSLTFTTAGMVDSAVKRVGDTTLTAAGTGGQGYGAA